MLLPTDFDDLEIVESKMGDKSFGQNYTNYFAEILKKPNSYCIFKFFYNHVRGLYSRKRSAPTICNGRMSRGSCYKAIGREQYTREKSSNNI